jgi:hypothetical protein
MNLFREKSNNPKINAQRNLCGRTHYVDDDTLRYHKSRVLDAGVTNQGLCFWIICSDALDPTGRRRGFRYVIFDVFGGVLALPDLANAFSASWRARKAMWVALNRIDAITETREAIERDRRYHEDALARLAGELERIEGHTLPGAP